MFSLCLRFQDEYQKLLWVIRLWVQLIPWEKIKSSFPQLGFSFSRCCNDKLHFLMGVVSGVQHIVSLFIPSLQLELKLLLVSSQLSEELDLFLSFLFLPTCPFVYLFSILTALVCGPLCTEGLDTLASVTTLLSLLLACGSWTAHWLSTSALLYCTFHLIIPWGSRVNTLLLKALVSYDTIMCGPHFLLEPISEMLVLCACTHYVVKEKGTWVLLPMNEFWEVIPVRSQRSLTTGFILLHIQCGPHFM